MEKISRLVESFKERSDLIDKEIQEKWFRKWRNRAIFQDYFLGGFDLDELENLICEAMEDKWMSGAEPTVSVREIAGVLSRDPHSIRDTMKRMERKGRILMVECRKTTKGQEEKRYAPREVYENLVADLPKDEEIRESYARLQMKAPS